MLLTFQFDAFRYALAKLINYDFSEKEKAQRLFEIRNSPNQD